MTEPPTDPTGERPTAGPPLPGPVERASRLTRSPEDRYLGGVAGGIARHLGIDPLLVRVTLAVLGLFGVGIVLYVALWALLPDDAQGTAAISTSPATRGWIVVVVGLLCAVFLLGPVLRADDGGALVVLALVAAVVLLVRERRARRTARRAGPTDATGATGAMPPARPGRRRRNGPLLLWPALAVTAVVWGALGLLQALGVDVRASLYPALGLTIVGVLLVVGAWRGRPALLGVLGLAMAVGLGVTSAGEAGAFDPEVTSVVPTSVDTVPASADFGSGRYELDLRSLDEGSLDDLSGRDVALRGDVGEIDVVLPAEVPVRVTGAVDVVGEIVVRSDGPGGGGCGGFGCTVDLLVTPDVTIDSPTEADLADLASPPLDLRLDLQAGSITVRSER